MLGEYFLKVKLCGSYDIFTYSLGFAMQSLQNNDKELLYMYGRDGRLIKRQHIYISPVHVVIKYLKFNLIAKKLLKTLKLGRWNKNEFAAGRGRPQKQFLSAVWASVWSKSKGGPSPGSTTAMFMLYNMTMYNSLR